jgi:hypothetical protein
MKKHMSIVEFDGYKVTYKYYKWGGGSTTVERRVGSVATSTTLGWLAEGSTMDLIATFKVRDAKMLKLYNMYG